MGEKSTAATVEERVSDVHRMLLLGVRRREILQFASKKKWGVSDRAIDEYIARATERIREAAEVDRALELGRAMQRLDDLYRSAIQAEDFRTALQVQKELTAMIGLAEAANLNVTFDFGDMQGAMDSWRDSIRSMGDKPDADDDADE